MDSTAVEQLAKINVEDFITSFGMENLHIGRSMLERIFLVAGRRFARAVLEYDDSVANFGIQVGAGRVLKRFVDSLKITGAENIPTQGPLLVLSNHPGMTDTVALFASLPRTDLKIVASDRPFLRALPATSKHLIFVPDEEGFRIQTLRSIAAHIRADGTVLTFPAGHIEPDPACMPGAVESLETWSDSIGFFARLYPDACIVTAFVSGVIAAPSLRHPLTHLRRAQVDRERLAASLQIIARAFFPSLWPVHVEVKFGPPVSASDLALLGSPREITRAFLEHARSLVPVKP
jgi:hypothetical protein